MSEIASKANARLTSNLTQPLVKKDDAAAHKMLFAALFGSGVVAEDVADPMVGGLAPVNAESDTDANQHGNADILAATQAVAMVVSGQRGTALKDELSADLDKSAKESSFIFEDDDIIGVNPMMIGPMPMQQQTGTSLPVTDTSAVMAQMAFEDEVTILRQNKGRAVLNTLISSPHPSGAQSQMSELSSSFSPQTIKSFEKPQSLVDSIDDIPNSELDIDVSPLRSDGRPDARLTFRPATYQLNINQAGLATSKIANSPDQKPIDLDENMQFDSPDEFLRAVAGQTERGVGGINFQAGFGDSMSPTAMRQMLLSGLSVGAQMSQQNNGQSGGQSGGLISANTNMTNGSMMDMLDMAQDNWTEMLLQRVERGLAGGKDRIDFQLNPRNLGRMRISLVVQNERASVHIQTETSAAAHLLNDAEARLGQMMDASGLKFGNLTSQYNQNFGGNFSGHNSGQSREEGSTDATASDTSNKKDEADAEISVEQTENLINMQA